MLKWFTRENENHGLAGGMNAISRLICAKNIRQVLFSELLWHRYHPGR